MGTTWTWRRRNSGLDTDELDGCDGRPGARERGSNGGGFRRSLPRTRRSSKKADGLKDTRGGGGEAVSGAGRERGEGVAEPEGPRCAAGAGAGEGRGRRARLYAKQHDDAGPAGALRWLHRAQTLTGSARVQTLQVLAGQRVVMSILDDRGQTDLQLAGVYGRWQTQVWMQHRIVRYLMLQSLAWIAFLVLAAAVADCRGTGGDPAAPFANRAGQGTLSTILTLSGRRVWPWSGILLVIFGVPQQTPTILGLATAGLTVVFQDFILAFFGWFVLMGRNGMRVCDWVEIDGVGGEVSEIGLFRTTLLETGNWTSRGHPTGRKVTFTNSFAIRGQFFNFTTHGQWMWDEIKLSVASGAAAYDAVQQIQKAVEDEAAKDTAEAEREWQRAAGNVGLGQFGAAPTVDLRPAASGMDLVVRFVTRASERFDRRNRLFETAMRVLREKDATLPAETPRP